APQVLAHVGLAVVQRIGRLMWVAPSEGASLAAPRRTTAPLIDGSEDARSWYLSNRGRDAGENGGWRSRAAAVGVR
ncbi:MAG TPA: hypothetical protein VIX37_22810, partial [Candidatus Sulfotelmatobacter sp.]